MRKHSNSKTRTLTAALCAVLAATLLIPETGNAASYLSANLRDVPQNAWYADHVAALDREYDLFHFTTCEQGFCPDEPIKRNVMAVWTVRILDNEEPGSTTETRFDDVPTETTQDQYYAGFINRLHKLGVTTGCGDGSGFCPEDSVTRAQMAAFLTRAFELPDGPPHGFDDIPEGAWYSNEVSALKASGITTGCGDDTGFCPQQSTTRAQMAVFLHRALNRDNPASTTSTTTVVPAVSDRVAPPLERCSQPGQYGHGRVSTLTGFSDSDPIYEAVAQGEPDSCEIIMKWWNEVTKLEANRAKRDEHPCEYPPKYNHKSNDVPVLEIEWNSPALYVQCWPRISWVKLQVSDPALEAAVVNILDHRSRPPSTRPWLEALWSCYRSHLQGPEPGSQYATTPDWCNWLLSRYGPAVRFAGVTDECAARMYLGRVGEVLAYGETPDNGSGKYGGEYSWSNCSTYASRLIPPELADAPFRQRCEAMVDAVGDARTDTVAARGGGTRDDVIAVVKAMYCDGTKDAVRQHAPKLQKYLPAGWIDDYYVPAANIVWADDGALTDITDIAHYWAAIPDTPCFEAALLVNARHAVLEGTPFSKVLYC